MDDRKKNIIYSVVLMTAILLVYFYRKQHAVREPLKLEGRTMGTTYHITYFDDEGRDFQKEVDSLLREVNRSINNYDSSSEVSLFNRSTDGIPVRQPYFLPPLRVAKRVYEASKGAFDPTVNPLVNAWGFGPAKRINPDSAVIDSLRSLVGYDRIRLADDSVTKTDSRMQLDFGGIGQGYGADVITAFLREKGIRNMLVELGGEGMAVGKNMKTGARWQIGILDPASTPEDQRFKAYVTLSDRSFTTSGNYFNYHIVDGVRYSHTIDPRTGYPSRKAILSASVFAPDATVADCWGTALMVLGHEQAIELLKAQSEIDAFLMYSGEDGAIHTYATPGIEPFLTIEQDDQSL